MPGDDHRDDLLRVDEVLDIEPVRPHAVFLKERAGRDLQYDRGGKHGKENDAGKRRDRSMKPCSAEDEPDEEARRDEPSDCGYVRSEPGNKDGDDVREAVKILMPEDREHCP